MHTRVEPRHFPKDFTDSSQGILIEPKNEKPIKPGKNNIYQKLAQSDVKYSLAYYVKIFENHKSPESEYIRKVMFLNSFTRGFTLNVNTKNKQQLSPWYIHNFIIPVAAFVEDILKNHPEITNEMAPPNYKKKLFRYEAKLIALDEPILPEIETFATKLQREQLYFSPINPPENQELLIEPGKTKESTIRDVTLEKKKKHKRIGITLLEL